jgi:hypothetical protein
LASKAAFIFGESNMGNTFSCVSIMNNFSASSERSWDFYSLPSADARKFEESDEN